jgi:hypothetical protein
MSPRLLFLLTTLHANQPFQRVRDRIDAQRAATRLSTRVLPVATSPYVLLEAA